MGLKTTIANAASTAKVATLDLWTSVTYKAVAPSAYNTSTGAVTSTTTSTSLSAILEEYSEIQIDGDAIRATDLKMTFLQADLSGNPDINDLVTHDSKDWSVLVVRQDPAEAIWEAQIRVAS